MENIFDDHVDKVDTSDTAGIGALDHVIGVFGELGESLDFLYTDDSEIMKVDPIDAVLNEFDHIETHLNQFKIDENLLIKPFKEPIDSITSIEAFQSLAGTAADNLEFVDEINIPARIEESTTVFESMTEIVSDTIRDISALEMKEDGQEDEQISNSSPFAQMIRFFGSLWESLLGELGEDQERWDKHFIMKTKLITMRSKLQYLDTFV